MVYRELEPAEWTQAGAPAIEAVGVDSGASLVKLCLLAPGRVATPDDVRESEAGHVIHCASWPSPSTQRVLELLARLAPARIGVTGCGARILVESLPRPVARLLEFDAWGRGANHLLTGMGRAPKEPYLLVSIGTGTSALRVDGDRVDRIGGSALGGGTALGLGRALTGCHSHHELARLAARGRRGGVDLLIADIYESSEIPLAGEATASSFGKLARSLEALPNAGPGAAPASPEDLAAALMGLVAENIALLCNAHAREAGVSTIVYGGSTLAENPLLIETVQTLTRVLGKEALMLPQSGHAGALGAMLSAS